MVRALCLLPHLLNGAIPTVLSAPRPVSLSSQKISQPLMQNLLKFWSKDQRKILVSAQGQRLGRRGPAIRVPHAHPSGITPTLSLRASAPSCRLFLSTHRLSPSFAEESCSYFRHFNPGESSEIFEVTTQKGEPAEESGEAGEN